MYNAVGGQSVSQPSCATSGDSDCALIKKVTYVHRCVVLLYPIAIVIRPTGYTHVAELRPSCLGGGGLISMVGKT